MTVPNQPKIYHIVHEDRLPSILKDGCLWCDATIVEREGQTGTTIGMNNIKARRLRELELNSHPGLYVGDCVPFYFCPRSVMLYMLHMGNHPDLSYRGGQRPIVHLEADLAQVVYWANENGLRWAFTLSNAGSFYFEDRADLTQLNQIDWNAVQASDFRVQKVKEGKQAEFLVEREFPWHLVERIGVASGHTQSTVLSSLSQFTHQPPVEVIPDWYY